MLWGATAAGTAIGRGSALLLAAEPGRADAAGTLGGGLLAGTAGGVLALSALDRDATDAGASVVGASYGAMLGALTPSLGERGWPGWNRRSTGGTLLGAGAGAVGGLALRRALHGDTRAVGLTALAGVDGAATGLGWGLLLAEQPRWRFPQHPGDSHRRRRRHDRRPGPGHGQLVASDAGLGRPDADQRRDGANGGQCGNDPDPGPCLVGRLGSTADVGWLPGPAREPRRSARRRWRRWSKWTAIWWERAGDGRPLHRRGGRRGRPHQRSRRRTRRRHVARRHRGPGAGGGLHRRISPRPAIPPSW